MSQQINPRFGIGLGSQGGNLLAQYDFRSMRFCWYFDWAGGSIEGPFSGVEYVPVIGAYGKNIPSQASIQGMINTHPERYPNGCLWTVGNEIGMDDGRKPSEYAVAYHDIYYAIKAINSTYRVSNGAVLPGCSTHMPENPTYDGQGNVTNRINGLDYISQARTYYYNLYGHQMPVDEYCMHGYTCAGWSDANLFKTAVNNFRTYMKNWGERRKPLYIKEFSPLGDTNMTNVTNFMNSTVSWLATQRDINIGMPEDDYHLVQRWAWFVIADGEEQYEGQWDNVALFDADSKVKKALGTTYQTLAEQYQPKMYKVVSSGATVALGQNITSGFVAGDTLTFSCMGATKGASGQLKISLNYIADGVKYDGAISSNTITGNTPWTKLQFNWIAPAGTTQIEPHFASIGTTESWMDSLSVVNNRTGAQLITNGGFETGSGSAPAPYWLWSNNTNYSFAGIATWEYPFFTPTISSLTINKSSINADNTDTMQITVTAYDANGFQEIESIRALINYQGGNAGQYRGYFSWGVDDLMAGYYGSIDTFGNATGGGCFGYDSDVYGGAYTTLVSCSTTFTEKQRTVVFTIKAQPTWTSPLTANDISGFVISGGQNYSWVNYDLNFSVVNTVASPTPTPVCASCGEITRQSYGVSSTASVSGWGAGNLVNNLIGWNNSWSSSIYLSSYYTEWAYILFNNLYDVYETWIWTTPNAQCFPTNFKIQYCTDAGVTWIDMPTCTYFSHPKPTGDEKIVKTAPKVRARGIRVYATKLGSDDYGNYALQIAELKAWGSLYVPTNTPTNTYTPTRTFTATATKTNTPIPPTATKTNTPIPPTNTFTATATKTNTPIPPTATKTNTIAPTNTNILIPTHTFTQAPTDTPVAIPTDTAIPCFRGDSNCDVAITPGDALLVFQIYLRTFAVTGEEPCDVLCAADYTLDGSITPGDSLCIFREYLRNPC